MSSKLDNVLGKLARDSEATSWYTQHLHLYLIHYAIVHIHFDQSRDSDVTIPLLYTSKQLERFYLDVVAVTHPSEAQLLINDLILNKLSGAVSPSGEIWPVKRIPKVAAIPS